MKFYTGTWHSGSGIAVCELEENRIRMTEMIEDAADPDFIIVSKDKTRMFVSGMDMKDLPLKGSVTEYDITDRHPVMTARHATQGDDTCHLELDAAEKHLYLANYGTGSVACFPAEGNLAPLCGLTQHSGSGPHPTRQESAHVHQCLFIPGTGLLAVCDLGTDDIITYRADAETGALQEHSRTHVHGGPRHIAFGANGLAYLAHELSNEVSVLRVEDGVFTPLQTLSTLPEGFDGANTVAAIRIREDGKKLFVSNRGHGSLAQYAIGEDGLLTFERHLFAGIFPRDFVQLPDRRFLIADQKAGVYLLDEDGNQLDFLPLPGAVCICCV